MFCPIALIFLTRKLYLQYRVNFLELKTSAPSNRVNYLDVNILVRKISEIDILGNNRLLQQPALGALTFLRSFVVGKANFCSQLLASLVHFTVVKSQAILIIRLGVTELFPP